MRDIFVRVTATQKSDNAQIELFSNTITLNISPSLRNDNTLIIAAAIAVLIIIIIITIITIIKYRKSKGKTHGKHKNFHKNKKPKKGQKAEAPKDDKPEIQVIKNYSGTGTGTGSNGGTGGNANFRPPENKSDGMDK